ncbi:MAG: MBL fold metallo-hydrolase [Planctomycetes bacterium]|nr:MBL fold metallo-hydrolase [Planctomycetota bacterium]
MQTFSLQSGSNGNCIYVEAGDVRLLFDAGISGTMAANRMAHYGRDIREVDALVISHDHIDHIRCAGIFQRKFGFPVYMTRATQQATWCDLGKLRDVRYFQSGDLLTFGRVTVQTVRTPHDAADGVVFVIEFEGKRLGIFTDLGHPFGGFQVLLESVDAAYLEANYEPEMLENGPYPPHLKERIRGDGGHLSNQESATLLRACSRRRPKWIAVAHLSEENNRPEHAMNAQYDAVGRDYPVYLAPRHGYSELLCI